MNRYPHTPGWRDDIASMEAAAFIKPKAGTIQAELLRLFELGAAMTSVSASEILNIPYHSVQPRFSELYRMGAIIKHELVPGPNGPRIWKWKLSQAWKDRING